MKGKPFTTVRDEPYNFILGVPKNFVSTREV
jgi:hypothetical protein